MIHQQICDTDEPMPIWNIDHTIHHPTPILCNSMYSYARDLEEQRDKITQCDWLSVSKKHNSLEFLNTTFPPKKKSVPKSKPKLSYFYFCLWELCCKFPCMIAPTILLQSSETDTEQCLVIPLQSVLFIGRSHHGLNDCHNGFSSLEDVCPLPHTDQITVINIATPGDKYSVLKTEEHGHFIDGLLAKAESCFVEEEKEARFDFVFSTLCSEMESDVGLTESWLVHLLTILTMQKEGGCAVLRSTRCIHKPSVDVLRLLCCCYEEIHLCKPETSGNCVREMFVVCLRRKSAADIQRGVQLDTALNELKTILLVSHVNVASLLTTQSVSFSFRKQVENFHVSMFSQYVQTLHRAINSFETSSFSPSAIQSEKNSEMSRLLHCIDFCRHHHIAVNSSFMSPYYTTRR